MPEQPRPKKAPQERYNLVPAKEGEKLIGVSAKHREAMKTGTLAEPRLTSFAVKEYEYVDPQKKEVRLNPSLERAAKEYHASAENVRILRERVHALKESEVWEKEHGLAGFGGLFESANSHADTGSVLLALEKELAAAEKNFQAMRDAVRQVRSTAVEIDPMTGRSPQQASLETLFALAREGDARRKYRAYELAEAESDQLGNRVDFLRDLLRIRRKAEWLHADEQEEAKFLGGASTTVDHVLAESFMDDIENAAAEAIRKRLIQMPERFTFSTTLPVEQGSNHLEKRRYSRQGNAWQEETSIETFRLVPFKDARYTEEITKTVHETPKPATVKTVSLSSVQAAFEALVTQTLLTRELTKPADVLGTQLDQLERQFVATRRDQASKLTDPRNAELVEFKQKQDFLDLLNAYHVDGKRFLPVGEIAEELASLDQIVTSPRGPILRALLYGPPGTGKTESLREIAERHGQKVRVISMHETSTFETLVGMHQIPLPKADTIADAERFWKRIENVSGDKLVSELSPEVLREFAGENEAAQAADFKKWFEMKLRTARSLSALGAVSADDPRIRKIQQEALAAWLDQSLAEGLKNDEIVILDEADRAGNAMEGLQDLLTRKPGDLYHPPGRPEAFRIGKHARVVMTANWGDLQTEFSGGGGKLAAPIVSRVVEKRKVNYLKADTERRLFEVMTSEPETGVSHLDAGEYRMVTALIEKVFPRLRDLYLRPGELHFVSPISVRTLENIKRRLIDETTGKRLRHVDGSRVHMVEAIWTELGGGPFREDQANKIRELLVRTLWTEGVFMPLAPTPTRSLQKQVAQLTGMEEAKIASFGALPGGLMHVAPTTLEASYRSQDTSPAKNAASLPPLTFPSVAAFHAELEKKESLAWRKRIEDLGGNPETVKSLAESLEKWLRTRATWEASVLNEPTKSVPADVRMVTEECKRVRQVSRGDLVAFVHILPELAAMLSPEDYRRSGLFLSLVYNHHVETTPPRMRQGTLTVDVSSLPKLDLLGFRVSDGNLTFKGEVGNEFGREMRNGTLSADRVGDKAGIVMSGGTLEIFETAGRMAGQQMSGGLIRASTVGEKAGLRMLNGKMEIGSAGERLGQEMKNGVIQCDVAGQRVGEQQSGGTINIGTVAVSFGSGIKGTIYKAGTIVYDNGIKVGS